MTRTWGIAPKSMSDNGGLWKLWNPYNFSRGCSFDLGKTLNVKSHRMELQSDNLYVFLSPSTTPELWLSERSQLNLSATRPRSELKFLRFWVTRQEWSQDTSAHCEGKCRRFFNFEEIIFDHLPSNMDNFIPRYTVLYVCVCQIDYKYVCM